MAITLKSLPARLSTAMKALRTDPTDIKTVAQHLDTLIGSGELPTIEKAQSARGSDFKRDVVTSERDQLYSYGYNMLSKWVQGNSKNLNNPPPQDDPSRDDFMAEYWKKEPILAGAVYSMVAKMESLSWSITGRRGPATEAAQMMSRSAHMGGFDWGGFIGSVAQDFYTVNRGVFIETAKDGDPLFGKCVDLGHIDALCCWLTGNSKSPVLYWSENTGQTLRFKPGEFIHFTSMPSPRERNMGSGFCAVDRAYRAAKLLLGLHDYDDQKLSNLPPEGIAAVTGLTMDEFMDAINLWKAQRTADNSLTFPQVLWLIGSQPNAAVSVNITGFSSLPESFNRKEVVDQYVSTLALDFGVDLNEFWTTSGGGGMGGGNAGQSEIQHAKAKGKGPGEFISTTERHLNGELPTGVDMRFDAQDTQESASQAAIAKAWIDAFMPLYNLPKLGKGSTPGEAGGSNGTPGPDMAKLTGKPAIAQKANPQPDKPNGQPRNPVPMRPNIDVGGPMTANQGPQTAQAEQVITRDDLMRLLADRGVLPDWMLNDKRTTVADNEVHNQWFKSEGHVDDYTTIVWEGGILKEQRPPVIEVWSSEFNIPAAQDTIDITPAELVTTEKHLDHASIQAALTFLKDKEAEVVAANRNIHGSPIPEAEVTRGTKVTAKTLRDELKRWREDPLLSKYALSEAEESNMLKLLQ